MKITSEMASALKFLRTHAGGAEFAKAFNTLDNAGVFAPIDQANDYEDSKLYSWTYTADVCDLNNEVIDRASGSVFAPDRDEAENRVLDLNSNRKTYLSNVRVTQI